MNDQCWRTKAPCSFLYSAQLSRVILTLEFPPYWISTVPSAQTDWCFPSVLESSQPFLFLSIFLFCFVNFFPLWKSIISDCTMVMMYMTFFLLFSFTFFFHQNNYWLTVFTKTSILLLSKTLFTKKYVFSIANSLEPIPNYYNKLNKNYWL